MKRPLAFRPDMRNGAGGRAPLGRIFRQAGSLGGKLPHRAERLRPKADAGGRRRKGNLEFNARLDAFP